MALKADEFGTLGQDARVSDVWDRASRKQKKKIIVKAHAQGLTVAGFLSDAPGALKERLPRALREQARSTIAAAYKPAETELDQKAVRIQALDDKRKNDNAHYLDWLNQQSALLKSDAQTADKRVTDAQQQIQLDTATAYHQTHADAVATAGGQTGVVSDPNQSKALDFTPEAKQANDRIANERQATQDQIGTSERHAASLAANNFATIAASEAKRASDTWQSLADVGDEKTKLKFQKGADSAKEVARLLDEEITKAQSNREFDVAVQKLGLDATKEANDQKNANKSANLAQKELDLKVKQYEHQARVDNLTLGIKRDSLDQADAHFAQQQELGWYNARHKGGKSRNGSTSQSARVGSTNQDAFDAAYASVAGGTRTVSHVVNGKTVKKTVRFDAAYVSANKNLMINRLMSQLGVNRKIATSALQAFADLGGHGDDPGDFAGWVRKIKGRRPT